MTSSPPLSPRLEKWVDACLAGMGEVDVDVGQKRLRPQLPVVEETLLSLEESELASIPSHGSASITVHSHGSCVQIVPETCVVYGTQNSQDLQQHGGGAAGPATGPTAAESDSDSDDGDVGSELPASLVDMQSLAGIPSEWAAIAHGDGTFTVTFNWSTASGDTAFSFLTSKRLGSLKRRGMGSYLRHALQAFMKLQPTAQYSSYFGGLLKAGHKGITNAGNNKDLKLFFAQAFLQSKKDITSTMELYVTSHPVKLFDVRNDAEDGRLIPLAHVPTHGDINALARVIVLMSEPKAQQMWHTIANENRSRAAVDDEASKRATINEAIELILLNDFFNNTAYTAPHTVNLSAYARNVHLDPSQPPSTPKSLPWFREQRRFFKVCMAAVQTAVVKKTGEGEQGADGQDADSRFWRYCRGDLVLMFMWLHWGRGHNVPSHCSALLSQDCIMDVGAGASSRSTVTVTSPSRSNVNSNLERLVDQIEKLTQPLLTLSGARANVVAAVGATSSNEKMQMINNLAARIQAFRSVLETGDGSNAVLVRARIDKLTAEMLELDAAS